MLKKVLNGKSAQRSGFISTQNVPCVLCPLSPITLHPLWNALLQDHQTRIAESQAENGFQCAALQLCRVPTEARCYIALADLISRPFVRLHPCHPHRLIWNKSVLLWWMQRWAEGIKPAWAVLKACNASGLHLVIGFKIYLMNLRWKLLPSCNWILYIADNLV